MVSAAGAALRLPTSMPTVRATIKDFHLNMDQFLISLTVEGDFLRDNAILTDREALTRKSKDRPDREVFGYRCH